jgi:hypothetical protein
LINFVGFMAGISSSGRLGLGKVLGRRLWIMMSIVLSLESGEQRELADIQGSWLRRIRDKVFLVSKIIPTLRQKPLEGASGRLHATQRTVRHAETDWSQTARATTSAEET